mmetsp:Transcript_17265/g.33914  ORF Transcript_17265/g.33914 Transcript_17265/m.33914 type:complete len:363 (+) Transcript_17265:91-1179(+)
MIFLSFGCCGSLLLKELLEKLVEAREHHAGVLYETSSNEGVVVDLTSQSTSKLNVGLAVVVDLMHNRVFQVDLELLLGHVVGTIGTVTTLLHHAHHTTKSSGLVVHNNGRGVAKTCAGADLKKNVIKLSLEPVLESLGLNLLKLRENLRSGLVLRSILLLGIVLAVLGKFAEVHISRLSSNKAAFVVLAKGTHDEIINGVVQEENLDIGVLENLIVRACKSCLSGRRSEVVDLVLGNITARDVLVKGCELIVSDLTAVESEQLSDLALVFKVSGGTFLKEVTVLGEDLLVVVLGVLLGLGGEESNDTASESTLDVHKESLVLHGLTRKADREVLGVHNTLNKAHPLRQKLVRVSLEKDLARI